MFADSMICIKLPVDIFNYLCKLSFQNLIGITNYPQPGSLKHYKHKNHNEKNDL